MSLSMYDHKPPLRFVPVINTNISSEHPVMEITLFGGYVRSEDYNSLLADHWRISRELELHQRAMEAQHEVFEKARQEYEKLERESA